MPVTITDVEAQSIVNARYAANPSAARKAAWSAIRARLGPVIPADAKLGVEVNPTEAHYGELYIKGTEPRQYIESGIVQGQMTGGRLAPDLIAGLRNPPAQGNGDLAVADTLSPEDMRWYVVSRDDLLALLRDSDYACVVPSYDRTPLPTNVGNSVLVLDKSTGNLYFRG